MKVSGTQTVEIHISDREADDIMIDRICKKMNWRKEYYIVNGKVMIEHDRHPRDWEEEIRVATDTDKMVYEFLLLLK